MFLLNSLRIHEGWGLSGFRSRVEDNKLTLRTLWRFCSWRRWVSFRFFYGDGRLRVYPELSLFRMIAIPRCREGTVEASYCKTGVSVVGPMLAGQKFGAVVEFFALSD